MYEEKSKSLNIEWKSLLIKLGVMLVIVFLFMWAVSLFTKEDKQSNESNLAFNLQTMQTAALEYFTGSRLPESINGQKKITLEEMLDAKLLIEFRDQDNNTCDVKESFAEATKITLQDYTIKVKLVCGDKSDYVIDTITIKQDNVIADIPDDSNDSNDNNDDTNIDDNNTSSDINSGNTNNGNSNSTTTNTSKPNTTVVVTKPSTNTSTNTSSSNTTTNSTTCTYGNKDYNTNTVLAYVIPGNCAVSKSDYYNAIYQTKVDTIGVQEYRKLVSEISELNNRTGANLVVSAPIYSAVYNNAGTGLVGYQITYIVKYYGAIVYEYYLDQNGNRKVIIDNRSGISNNTSSSTVVATNLSLNSSYVDLYVGDVYNTNLMASPTNASVTWTSTNTSVATVSETGVITARRAGTVLVTAKSGSKSVSMTVKVRENSTLTLTNSSVSLYVGDTYKIGYTSNGAPKYSSSNTNVATVTSTGQVVAEGSGNAVIYVTVGNVQKTLAVSVTKKPTSTVSNSGSSSSTTVVENRVTNYVISAGGRKIDFNVVNPEVGVGATLRLNFSGNYFNCRPTWTSTNPSVASVDQYGNVTGHKTGSVLIYASDGAYAVSYIEVKVVANDNNIVYNTTTFVNTSGGRKIDFNAANPKVQVGSILKLYATPNYFNPQLTWSSTNPDVATVDQEGCVLAYKKGTTLIYVADGNYAASYILVTVV